MKSRETLHPSRHGDLITGCWDANVATGIFTDPTLVAIHANEVITVFLSRRVVEKLNRDCADSTVPFLTCMRSRYERSSTSKDRGRVAGNSEVMD